MTTLPDWLAHRAHVTPTALAVEMGGEGLDYQALDRWARSIAAALAAQGVEAGDRVALLAPNGLLFAAAVHGILRAGGVLVPLNLRLTPADQAWQVEHSGARLLFFDEQVRDAGDALSRLSGCQTAAIGNTAGEKPGPGIDAHDSEAPLAIIYTSGTTRRPKGATLTYGNFWASAAASAFNIGVRANDRWLACMPLFHVGGLSILLRSAIYGTAAVIQPGFVEAAVNQSVREDGITLLSVVPTMLKRMLDADDLDYPAAVRAVLVGGGPVDRELLERALGRGLPVLQTYGLTESCSQVTTLSPADAAAHVGSAGKPLVSTRVRLDAPPGEAGEILVSGPTVTPGYWRDPGATARAIRDGWLHTGDIGRFDEDGFLAVLDRRDDLIVTGGENVYPSEVEEALRENPAIEDVAVVGLPDAEWGQVVVAAVVARAAFDDAEAAAWARERLAHYKVPRRWLVVDALPMTASGKVQRHLVRDALAFVPDA